MSIDELIERLQVFKNEVGNVEVYSLECGYEKPIDHLRVGYYNDECVVLDYVGEGDL